MNIQVGKQAFVLEPLAIFHNFDTGAAHNAQLAMKAQQREETPGVAPLPYRDDPMIVVPDALIVNIDGKEDIVFSDTNHPVTHLLWETGLGTFVVPVGHCYDYETMRKVM